MYDKMMYDKVRCCRSYSRMVTAVKKNLSRDPRYIQPLRRLHIISSERSSRHMFTISSRQVKDWKCPLIYNFWTPTISAEGLRTSPRQSESLLGSYPLLVRQPPHHHGGDESSGPATFLWMPPVSFATIAPLVGLNMCPYLPVTPADAGRSRVSLGSGNEGFDALVSGDDSLYPHTRSRDDQLTRDFVRCARAYVCIRQPRAPSDLSTTRMG
jgi:hypothetical protein